MTGVVRVFWLEDVMHVEKSDGSVWRLIGDRQRRIAPYWERVGDE